MPKVAVRKADAEKVLAEVKRAFSPWISQQGSYLPVLVKDYEPLYGGVVPYAIVWEDGSPYDWPQLIHGGRDEEYGFKVDAISVPDGVFVEAESNIVLGIYEA